MQMQLFSRIYWKGTSANAGPHYQKLYARVTHIWGNRRGQPSPSAMKGPHPERTASMITFSCFIDNLHVDTVAAQLAKCQKRFGLVFLVQDCVYYVNHVIIY